MPDEPKSKPSNDLPVINTPLFASGEKIAKINVATAIRQPYERAVATSVSAAQQAVYEATRAVLEEELAIAGNAALLTQ